MIDQHYRRRLAKHARWRLRTRAKVWITSEEYHLLCEHIRWGGAGAPIARCDNKTPLYRLTIRGKEVYAIWVPELEQIRTFITEEQLGYRQALQMVEGVSFGGYR